MRILRHLSANAEKLTLFGFRRELSMQSYLIENEGVLTLDEIYCDAEIITEELAVKQGRRSKDTDCSPDCSAVQGGGRPSLRRH